MAGQSNQTSSGDGGTGETPSYMQGVQMLKWKILTKLPSILGNIMQQTCLRKEFKRA
jgi:hypothetical protein